MRAPLLAVRSLHLRHPGSPRDVVRDVHLALHRGEILTLVGPNGSGKSTLLAGLARDLPARFGQLEDAAGRSLARVPRHLWARQVARLPQEPSCPADSTVRQLVSAGRHSHRQAFRGLSPADHRAVQQALAWTALDTLAHRPMGQLSGGERRRAWLAMVLAQECELLLLDEPLAGLDLRQRLEVLELLRWLAREQNRTLVVVLHELAEAVQVADRLGLVHRGRLYACGPPREVLTPEALRDVFGLDARLEDTPEGPRLIVFGVASEQRFL